MGTSATASLPTDWRVSKDTVVRSVSPYITATLATERQGGNGMANNASNGVYNFGAGDPATATDRAVGFLSSSSATKSGNLYAQFSNSTGFNLPAVVISYNVEKYRRGSNAAGFSLQMYYSFNGSTWTSAGSNFRTNFTADADATGYTPAPGVTTAISNQTLMVNIPQGSNFYLAWNYSVSSGTTTSYAQALAIDDFSIIAVQPPALTIRKAAPASVLVNENFTYTLTANNTLGTLLTGVVLTDSLPVSVTFQSASNGGVLLAGNVISWTVPSLADGTTVSRTVTVKAPADPVQVINADYGVWASNWVTRTVGTAVNTNIIAPPSALTVSKTALGTVNINQVFTYTLSVYNILGKVAANVVVTDSLPVSATFQSASDGGVLLPGNVVSWTISSMANNTTAVRTVSVTAPAVEKTLTNADYGVWASNWLTRTLGSSSVVTTIKDPNAITPIAVARAAGKGWSGNLRGNVTVPPNIYRPDVFVIQDATGGMYVYAGITSLPAMALGDVVEVRGTIDAYNGLLEISPMTSATRVGSGIVPTPAITTTVAVTSTQGLLIQVSGTASWSTTPPAPGASDWSFYINDGSGPVKVFVDKDTKIDMRAFTSPMPMRIIGFSGAFNTAQIMPRYQSDIIDLRPPSVVSTVPLNGATGVSPYYPLSATFSKAMKAASIDTASFTLIGPSGNVSGSVSYNGSTRTASFTPAAALTPFASYTAQLSASIQDAYDVPLPAPYTWSFTTGAADTTPPAITGQMPLPNATGVALSSSVVISFTEDLHPSSLDASHFILQGPYGALPNTLQYNAATFVVTLAPSARLLPTTHYTVTVKGNTADWAGLTLGSDVTWAFETSVEPPMNVYFGDLHNHTSNSDGSGTPAQALAAGEAAGFDFMAITDHSYAIDDSEWANTLAAVNAATDADFVGLRGFEYTQGAEGHINVYNTVRHAVRANTGCASCDYTPNLEAGATVKGFYQWLAISGTIGIDSAGTVMQFNHPGWINFNDWGYHPEVSSVARLEEIGNGNGTSYAFSEDEFIRSLDYGWKVGATNNADTHSAYWGLNTDHRTGVLMPELTKTALLEALRERRTFATEDKNFTLSMKANGAWMGSEMLNTGSIVFEITGSDPDGELPSLVQIITDQGKVLLESQPGTANFTWQPQINITTGVHYFYIKVTQADGDRIVTSPVWTNGSEDIAITDIVIQPTVPTIYNASLLTARVTNRVVDSRTVTVTMEVNGVPLLPAVVVMVPGNGDAYANFSWQPSVTGAVTVTAELEGAPAGDNPDDNSASLQLTVTDEHLPLILIDAGHGNTNALGREFRMFIDDLSAHRYNVLKNLDTLTASDLDPTVVKLLIITAPQTAYSGAEQNAIADFVNAGGSLWLCGLADYAGKVPWATTVADRLNPILDRIETRTGATVNMRMNDDEVIDGNDNNGYVFGVAWSDFPSSAATSIGINVKKITSWSLNSIRGRTVSDPLTASTPGVQIVIQGDLDAGYTGDSHHNPYHTSNTDADNAGDAYIYNPTWVYPAGMPVGAIPLPMAAVTDLPGDAGRIMLYGDSSDAFTTFAYTAGDGLQNELFNLQSVMWLLGQPLQKSTIADIRVQSTGNQPANVNQLVNLDKLVWVEGEITAAYGEFFNVLYVQDETGGITVHAPAGDIDAGSYTRGTKVRVVGTVGMYNGDTEIEFFEAEMVQVISPSTGEVKPLPFSTYQASLESNQGWLGIITGTVTLKVGSDTLIVNDGSGPVRIFLDGYNGDFSSIKVNDRVRVTGLISEDGDGGRIRVRNYKMHSEYADDVVILPTYTLGLTKSVSTPAVILPGSLVTYTLVLSNTGNSSVAQIVLTDTLPTEVSFKAFVTANGATQSNGVVSWKGDLAAGQTVTIIFTAITGQDKTYYGRQVTNTAYVAGDKATSTSSSVSFTFKSLVEYKIFLPLLFK